MSTRVFEQLAVPVSGATVADRDAELLMPSALPMLRLTCFAAVINQLAARTSAQSGAFFFVHFGSKQTQRNKLYRNLTVSLRLTWRLSRIVDKWLQSGLFSRMAEDSNSLGFDWFKLKCPSSRSNIHPRGASTIKRPCTSSRKLKNGSKK
jgi:hypothetical protein